MTQLTPMQERTERTVLMAQNGIKPVYDHSGQYWIKSQHSNKKYRTTLNGCTCPDNKKGYVCKHILLLKDHLELANVPVQKCPKCDSERIVRNGSRKLTSGRKQLWKCQACRYGFAFEDLREYKASQEIIVKCMDMYVKGKSYRNIANTLKQFHGLNVSQVSVMTWLKKYVKIVDEHLKRFNPSVSKTWHADEQFLKVRGSQKYVWNCLDGGTKFLLASHVSDRRDNVSATKLFKEAKQTAGRKDVQVVTDGAFSYDKAVRKEFWTYANKKPHSKYVSLRQKTGNNNPIERYHGTYKDRVKSMRCMKTMAGANAYNTGFRNYYNYIRPHIGLEGKTPAQASGINVKPGWNEILQNALKKTTQK